VTSLSEWVAGARVRTLPASVVPVAVGTGVASTSGDISAPRVVLAAIVALTMQLGTNYANDYSDGVRGTDDDRVGPMRLVASGTASPTAVKAAAVASFAVAAVAGLVLAALAGWWLIGVGLASIAAGWLYTGGPRPYGYLGLGEVFVFVFFGLVATAGTAYVQQEAFSWLGVAASVPVGLLAVALLITNNLRDRPLDAESGKRTLAVRLGDTRTRKLYVFILVVVFVSGAVLSVSAGWAFIVLAGVVLAVAPARAVLSGAQGVDLIPVLGATGKVQLAFGVLLTLGLVLS
jgi:1,4-dihydroxy-2-naphthoate octaprenyltransferase